jgi:hypothetical protein
MEKKEQHLRLHLEPFFGSMPLANINEMEICRFKATRKATADLLEATIQQVERLCLNDAYIICLRHQAAFGRFFVEGAKIITCFTAAYCGLCPDIAKITFRLKMKNPGGLKRHSGIAY